MVRTTSGLSGVGRPTESGNCGIIDLQPIKLNKANFDRQVAGRIFARNKMTIGSAYSHWSWGITISDTLTKFTFHEDGGR